MKTQAIRLLATAALFLAAVAPAAAQELKIGYVNSERVLREAAPAKAAQGKLEAEFSRRERDLNEQTARLKAAADKLQKEEPTLAEAERSAASANSSSRTATCSASGASSRKTSRSAATRNWRRWWNAPTAPSSRSSTPRNTTSSCRRWCSRVRAWTLPRR